MVEAGLALDLCMVCSVLPVASSEVSAGMLSILLSILHTCVVTCHPELGFRTVQTKCPSLQAGS